MLYNNGTLGSSAIAILGEGNSLTPVIGGNFSTALTGGAGGDAMISQTGLVPANANTMFFDMYAQGYGPMDLAVSLNGQAINTLLYSTSSGYNTYAADVSSFAGQTAHLAFNAVSSYPAGFEQGAKQGGHLVFRMKGRNSILMITTLPFRLGSPYRSSASAAHRIGACPWKSPVRRGRAR